MIYTTDKIENASLYFGEKWYIRISEKGIEFNHKEYPDYTPDDFALKFMECVNSELEKWYIWYMSKNFPKNDT